MVNRLRGRERVHNPDWHKNTLKRIDDISASMDKRTAKRFQADLLKRIATRLEQFSTEGCRECDNLKNSFDQLVALFEQLGQGGTIDSKEHKTLLQSLIKHLRLTHKLIEEGTNLSMWLSIGLMFGVVFQSSQGPAFLGLGLCLGVAIGSALDASAKKAGKVL